MRFNCITGKFQTKGPSSHRNCIIDATQLYNLKKKSYLSSKKNRQVYFVLDIAPTQILMTYVYTSRFHISQSSSEKLLCGVGDCQHRALCLVKVHGREDCRMIFPVIALPPKAEGPLWERRRKDHKAGWDRWLQGAVFCAQQGSCMSKLKSSYDSVCKTCTSLSQTKHFSLVKEVENEVPPLAEGLLVIDSY